MPRSHLSGQIVLLEEIIESAFWIFFSLKEWTLKAKKMIPNRRKKKEKNSRRFKGVTIQSGTKGKIKGNEKGSGEPCDFIPLLLPWSL